MKIICFVPFVFLLSCTSIRIQVNEINTILGLRGNVKMLEIKSSRFEINEKGTREIKELKTQSKIILNHRNKILKQTDQYYNAKMVNIFNYKNNLLINSVSEINNRDKQEYKYDRKNNIIEVNDFKNDTLVFHRTYKYDSKNNPIEINKVFYFDGQEKREILKNVYNYNERTYIQYNTTSKYNPNDYFKTYFSKKGFIIKEEGLDFENRILSSTIYDYDSRGNLIKQIYYNQDHQPTQELNYKYIYDKKGNATMIREYLEDKITELTTIKITYR